MASSPSLCWVYVTGITLSVILILADSLALSTMYPDQDGCNMLSWISLMGFLTTEIGLIVVWGHSLYRMYHRLEGVEPGELPPDCMFYAWFVIMLMLVMNSMCASILVLLYQGCDLTENQVVYLTLFIHAAIFWSFCAGFILCLLIHSIGYCVQCLGAP